ncbi:excisionase family DNA-binding protein [Micropruina sonneratiae]|uniref:excisionase family DNA-binding protein n=1 Tax=Micropruina sonneratiae TaxID=2986940 RepID=UPI002227B79D|nr:excisionase family DNA-binding protein [Micropruina sp. KQZ13P-5]MCW3159453.1 excisionase family DNA-binding protein [Micropruina sp. KQZ13P-5]
MSPARLSIAEAARRIGVSDDTIRRRIANGQLKAVRSGRIIRISEDALEQMFHPIRSSVRGRRVSP